MSVNSEEKRWTTGLTFLDAPDLLGTLLFAEDRDTNRILQILREEWSSVDDNRAPMSELKRRFLSGLRTFRTGLAGNSEESLRQALTALDRLLSLDVSCPPIGLNETWRRYVLHVIKLCRLAILGILEKDSRRVTQQQIELIKNHHRLFISVFSSLESSIETYSDLLRQVDAQVTSELNRNSWNIDNSPHDLTWSTWSREMLDNRILTVHLNIKIQLVTAEAQISGGLEGKRLRKQEELLKAELEGLSKRSDNEGNELSLPQSWNKDCADGLQWYRMGLLALPLMKKIQSIQETTDEIPEKLRSLRILSKHFHVFIAGCTLTPEDHCLAEAFAKAKLSFSNLPTILVIAPRSAGDVPYLKKALTDGGFRVQLISRLTEKKIKQLHQLTGLEKHVVLFDIQGCLLYAYYFGAGAFIGGGLLHEETHNFGEPLGFGVQTWVGPFHRAYQPFFNLVESQKPELLGVTAVEQVEEMFVQWHEGLKKDANSPEGYTTRQAAFSAIVDRIRGEIHTALDRLPKPLVKQLRQYTLNGDTSRIADAFSREDIRGLIALELIATNVKDNRTWRTLDDKLGQSNEPGELAFCDYLSDVLRTL